jgi:pyruvate dehydrogenase E1 component alpha subunit
MTARVRGHFEGDAQKYRDADEIASLAALDPLPRLRQRLAAQGLSDAEIRAIDDATAAQLDAALAAARAGGEPDFEAAAADVYTNTGLA